MKKQARFAAILTAFLLFSISSYAAHSADNSSFAQANAKYQAGDFKNAARLYQEAIDSKMISSAVYYNLGNAMLRLGNKGQALVCFQRALVIAPRDADIHWNLHVLKNALPDRIEELSPNVFRAALSVSLDFVTSDEIALFLLGCVCALFLLAAVNLIFPPSVGWTKFLQTLSVICLIVSAVLLNLKWRQSLEPQVVVLDREVIARNGPSTEESKAFLLHEGAEAKVIDESKDWYYVALANKNSGWIPKESCEIV